MQFCVESVSPVPASLGAVGSVLNKLSKSRCLPSHPTLSRHGCAYLKFLIFGQIQVMGRVLVQVPVIRSRHVERSAKVVPCVQGLRNCNFPVIIVIILVISPFRRSRQVLHYFIRGTRHQISFCNQARTIVLIVGSCEGKQGTFVGLLNEHSVFFSCSRPPSLTFQCLDHKP